MASLCSMILQGLRDHTPHIAYAMLPKLLDALNRIDDKYDTTPEFWKTPTSEQRCLWNVFLCIRAKVHHLIIILVNFTEELAELDNPFKGYIFDQRIRSITVVRLLSQEVLQSVTRMISLGGAPRHREMSWGDKLKEAFCLARLIDMSSATGWQRRQAGDLFHGLIQDLGVSSSLLVDSSTQCIPQGATRLPPELLQD